MQSKNFNSKENFMRSSKTKKTIYAISILVGTIIGVGYLALPYVASKVGFSIMFFYILAIGIIAYIIHLIFAEVALETKDFLRFPGYVKVYFGKRGEQIASVLIILSILGALLAYLIVGGEFLAIILMPILGGNILLYTLIYFLIGAVLVYFGISIISRVEYIVLITLFVVLAAIFLKAKPLIHQSNLFLKPNLSYLFLPYGALLFAFYGLTMIPEAEEILKKDKKLLKKIVVPTAILISIIVYALFTFLVLGITGTQTTELAIPALKNFLGNGIVNLALLFGITTTFSSFLCLGLTLQKTLWYDFKINKKIAWFFACFAPLGLFLIGLRSFLSVISFIGAIVLGIEGILVVLMYQKLKTPSKTKKMLVLPLILVFVLGIVYEIIYFIK